MKTSSSKNALGIRVSAQGSDNTCFITGGQSGWCGGTVIGSGTVSSRQFRETGSCCIAERRAIEMIDHGAPRAEFLRFEDRVRMSTKLGAEMHSPFGVMDQQVVSWTCG